MRVMVSGFCWPEVGALRDENGRDLSGRAFPGTTAGGCLVRDGRAWS